MSDIALRRLRSQRLTGEPFASAVVAVRWLGAVQAQDYGAAKWALGQRTRDVTDSDLDRAFDEGALLRTHVMRPTWHFVLPDDIRWLLELTAPRVKAAIAFYGRQLEVDPALLRRSYPVLEAALGGGRHLTRQELSTVVAEAGIQVDGQRLGHVLMNAELDAVVASGPRRGRQFTYALLAERAPNARRLDRDEALAELTRRYFSGHGPAQLADCVWWSGLTVADVKRGLVLTGNALAHEVIGRQSYWSSPDEPTPALRLRAPVVHLLPNFDEFLVGYRDRSAALDSARGFDPVAWPTGGVLAPVVAVDGQVWGAWSRRLQARHVIVELGRLDTLDASQHVALHDAAGRLAAFLGSRVTLAAPAG
ncbi:MAG: winged helix DNA-binding domain-containing protein [Chloroflexota bacterium]|nr:winged helix DNA-binding domain-containing protein [Chloroflexota bacterium]